MPLDIIIIIGFGALFYYFFTQKKSSPFVPGNDINNTVTLTDNYLLDIKKRFTPKLQNIINKYNLKINPSMISALIFNELPKKDFIKPNKDVFGDSGNSYGYMQVSRPALLDVNYNYKLNYSMSDLLNEDINLTVGTLYFALCYNSAIKEKSYNPVKLAYKKYNGGIDETDNSKNLMASNYSDKAYNNYITLG